MVPGFGFVGCVAGVSGGQFGFWFVFRVWLVPSVLGAIVLGLGLVV